MLEGFVEGPWEGGTSLGSHRQAQQPQEEPSRGKQPSGLGPPFPEGPTADLSALSSARDAGTASSKETRSSFLPPPVSGQAEALLSDDFGDTLLIPTEAAAGYRPSLDRELRKAAGAGCQEHSP